MARPAGNPELRTTEAERTPLLVVEIKTIDDSLRLFGGFSTELLTLGHEGVVEAAEFLSSDLVVTLAFGVVEELLDLGVIADDDGDDLLLAVVESGGAGEALRALPGLPDGYLVVHDLVGLEAASGEDVAPRQVEAAVLLDDDEVVGGPLADVHGGLPVHLLELLAEPLLRDDLEFAVFAVEVDGGTADADDDEGVVAVAVDGDLLNGLGGVLVDAEDQVAAPVNAPEEGRLDRGEVHGNAGTAFEDLLPDQAAVHGLEDVEDHGVGVAVKLVVRLVEGRECERTCDAEDAGEEEGAGREGSHCIRAVQVRGVLKRLWRREVAEFRFDADVEL
ncbi:flagellar assembly protein H [Babesia caballi]|uniref:Flagellar assembly protein H n=1 Tax=Babesia caballi TaxID=5871 RepID=A0AAV4M2L7_BABCB|nr:flagellar assembly protein H [Babesia caballi]